MNKAFVREPDDTLSLHCPRCGWLAEPVERVTLDAQLRPEVRGQLGDSAFFCPAESCPVAYFDAFERSIEVEGLVRAVYPKDRDAPICACFGLTEDDIELDLREGTVTRTRAAIERARAPDARCAERAASGRSCIGDVQRYYMRRRAELGTPSD